VQRFRCEEGRRRRRDTAAAAAVPPYVHPRVGAWPLTLMRMGRRGDRPLRGS
jgi:hypothetical protein